MILYNKIDRRELKLRLFQEDFDRRTLSFYCFVEIDDPQKYRDELFLKLSEMKVFGRIYVAREGINAQISVPLPEFDRFKAYIKQHPYTLDVLLNEAIEDNGKSFYKLKILVKYKILSDGLDNSTFDIYDVGKHLDAESYNQKLSEPETVVIDLRNHYEHEVGHFENAILPDVDTYKESIPVIVELLKEKQPKNIMLYCTGGIRCEKFSAYLRHQGFEHVFQLKGGVINYAHQVRELEIESKFKGKNFVFDDRMGERVTNDVIARCHQCGEPADVHVNCANDACHLLFIQCEKCAEKYRNCCSEACKSIIQLPVEEQIQLRKGKVHANAHHKSRYDNLKKINIRVD
ncbi:MAG: rhodanese-related sulfurtransferase [Bacteroidales bacterium]|jgi:UPF0176 protein|nr:rhodanese-related sulfurtransferase [Bacteroidales bacterium]HOI32937.1 rhodanese-related sulfurtransferase [Bacteroidales bacterium]